MSFVERLGKMEQEMEKWRLKFEQADRWKQMLQNWIREHFEFDMEEQFRKDEVILQQLKSTCSFAPRVESSSMQGSTGGKSLPPRRKANDNRIHTNIGTKRRHLEILSGGSGQLEIERSNVNRVREIRCQSSEVTVTPVTPPGENTALIIPKQEVLSSRIEITTGLDESSTLISDEEDDIQNFASEDCEEVEEIPQAQSNTSSFNEEILGDIKFVNNTDHSLDSTSHRSEDYRNYPIAIGNAVSSALFRDTSIPGEARYEYPCSKRGRKSASIWEHFVTERIDNKVISNQCKLCNEFVSPKPFRMNIHFEKCRERLQKAALLQSQSLVPIPMLHEFS